MTEYVLGEVPADIGIRFVPKAEWVKQEEQEMTQEVSVPPFKVAADRKVTGKPYTLEDALRHARMVEEAWRRAGHNVRADIIKEVRGNREVFKVRMPDLINGLPKREVC